jgi:hypothetical protein
MYDCAIALPGHEHSRRPPRPSSSEAHPPTELGHESSATAVAEGAAMSLDDLIDAMLRGIDTALTDLAP